VLHVAAGEQGAAPGRDRPGQRTAGEPAGRLRERPAAGVDEAEPGREEVGTRQDPRSASPWTTPSLAPIRVSSETSRTAASGESSSAASRSAGPGVRAQRMIAAASAPASRSRAGGATRERATTTPRVLSDREGPAADAGRCRTVPIAPPASWRSDACPGGRGSLTHG
jgi:hypothetical protein